MHDTTRHVGDSRLVAGLFIGTFIGAGLALWLAPRGLSGVRDRVTRLADSARSVGDEVSEKYQQASVRIGEMVDDVTQKGRDVRDDIAGAVAHGAREIAHGALEVERMAAAAARRGPVRVDKPST